MKSLLAHQNVYEAVLLPCCGLQFDACAARRLLVSYKTLAILAKTQKCP